MPKETFSKVFDLGGFQLGRIEATQGDDGKISAMLTLVQPQTDDDGAQSFFVFGFETINLLGMICLEFTASWRDSQLAREAATDIRGESEDLDSEY